SGLVAPTSYAVTLAPEDVTPAGTSAALDHALPLANVNDRFDGAGPDLGAVEAGCPTVLYGVRPDGIDETNEPYGCGGPVVTTTSTTTTTLPYVPVETTAFSLKDDNVPPIVLTRRKVAFR